MFPDLLRIKDSKHLAVPALQLLYEEAFPAKERREFSQLLTLLQQPDMYLFVMGTTDKVDGLCIYWQLDGFYFLEHFAIAPELRGQGFGQYVMRWLVTRTDWKLVLEVERPVDETSRKRIHFYLKRLGFTLHDAYDYDQPPYQKGGQPVPLYLMTALPVADTADLEQLADQIKQQVYERFYT